MTMPVMNDVDVSHGSADKKRKADDEPVEGAAVPVATVPAPAPTAPPSRLLIKRHSENARVPTRGSLYSAGYDLYRFVDDDALLDLLRIALTEEQC